MSTEVYPGIERNSLGEQIKSNITNQEILLTHLITQPQTIVENIPEAVLVVDHQGRLIYLNRTAQDLVGQPRNKLRLEDWPKKLGFFLDDGETHYPGEKMPLVRALQGAVVSGEEMILRSRANSNGIWIVMSAKPLLNEKGEISGAIALFRDITLRKQIEQSREKHAQRNEALYKFSRAIAEAGNDFNKIVQVVASHTAESLGDASLVATLNPEGDRFTIVAFNHPSPVAQALLRKYLISVDYDVEHNFVGGVIRSGETLLIPSIPAEKLEALTFPGFKNYIREIGVQSMLIVPITGRSGVLGALALFKDRGGRPYTIDDQSFLETMATRTGLAIENYQLFESLRKEIEERLSTTRALEESEERFRSIFESTTLGIKLLDLEGNLLQINPAFGRMIGYSEAEILGKKIFSFMVSSDSKRGEKFFSDITNNGPTDFRYEHRLLHKDGSIIWVNTTFTGIKQNGDGETPAFIVGIAENITEQKRIELEMVDLKNRLQGNIEMERLRLAQELHDGPMQELYSAIYQIEGLRKQVNPEAEKELIHLKMDLQNILQELRNSAKELRPPTISNFGLEKAIRSHVEDIQEKNPDIQIDLNLAQDRQYLPEDIRLALFRVFQQSLTNVLRHAEAKNVQVQFSFDAEGAYLEIVDDGKGFVVPKSWVEFARQGHYGLAGAAERVDLLGGTFAVESQPGQGTTIRVAVPYKECAK